MKKYFILTILLFSFACFPLELPVPGNVALPATAETTSAVTETSLPTAEKQCIVNTTALNLRECAGTHCTAEGWLHEGDLLTILYQQDQWLKVETQTRDIGWVHSKYCTGE